MQRRMRLNAPTLADVTGRAIQTLTMAVGDGSADAIRCAYQGVPGAYSEGAAMLAYAGCASL
jgi:hypothetical protein